MYALRADPAGLPAFRVTECLPGESLPSHPDPDSPGPARALGRVIRAPTEFNAEFLMQRFVDEPAPVVETLYEPLPLGPDVARGDLYRLLAMGREVAALDLWYDAGSDTHERRGDRLTHEIEQIRS